MLCYRDMTFCPKDINKECAERIICDRVMTPADEKRTEDSAFPVAYFADKPECFKEKENGQTGRD